jgi:oxygen-independent coproporphyrinogen-3 oxidase
LEPYAGFGADAHSFDGHLRRQNAEDAKEYCERSESGEPLRVFESEANLTEERFFVGLRLSAGVVPEPEDWERWRVPIERFMAGGLLERQGGTLRLTEQGLLFSNEVFQEFIGGVPIEAARA